MQFHHLAAFAPLASLGALAQGDAAPAGAPAELTPENLPALHALMQPRADETAWLDIPWHADLWSARAEAARTGKPIYLWEMDGHPLGCT